MPKVELDEEDVRRYGRLESAVNTLWANPKARELIQQAQKIVDPNAKTPDLDARQAMLQPVEAVQKEFRDYVAKTEADKAEAVKTQRLSEIQSRHATGIAELRRQKYTDEGIKKIEALMEEKGILDPLDAAAIFERSNPPPALTTPSSNGVGGWNFAEATSSDANDFAKKLMETKGALDGIVENEARNAIAEVRGQSRR